MTNGNESFRENINCIKEINQGVFQIILDFATTDILRYLLRDSHKYVWVHNHVTGPAFKWQQYNLPILENKESMNVIAKEVSFDFIMPTEEFRSLLGKWEGGITLLQINQIPPDYLNLNKIKGKKRFELLKNECDYLFEVDISSATDYGRLISPHKRYLQSLLDNPDINWQELP